MAESMHSTDIRNYSEVSWYRRRWFLVLSILFCAPVTIAIAGTGDVYALKEGRVWMYTDKQKNGLIVASCALMAMGLMRACLNP